MVSIQEWFVIKSGLWWRTHGMFLIWPSLTFTRIVKKSLHLTFEINFQFIWILLIKMLQFMQTFCCYWHFWLHQFLKHFSKIMPTFLRCNEEMYCTGILGNFDILQFEICIQFDELNFFPSLKTNWLFLPVQTVLFSKFLS